MRVYVILVNFNGWRDTVECLESILSLDYHDYRVVICDNGSTDESIRHLVEWAERMKGRNCEVTGFMAGDGQHTASKQFSFKLLSRHDLEPSATPQEDPFLVVIDCISNLGFGGGNNVGLRYALARGDCSYAWLLNNDTVVDRNALKCLVARMKAMPSAGMCGSTLLHYDRPNKVQALGGGYYCKWIGLPWHIGRLRSAGRPFSSGWSERWMNYIVGASLLVSSEFISSVGLMAEEYFLYFEELDWALRGKERFSLAYAPESIVYHKIGASIGTTSNPATKSYLSDYYNVKNRITFTRKYFPHAMPTIYLTLLVAMGIRALCGKWGRVAMIWRVLTGMERAIHPEGIRN